jgi:hypothetical protein
MGVVALEQRFLLRIAAYGKRMGASFQRFLFKSAEKGVATTVRHFQFYFAHLVLGVDVGTPLHEALK